VVIVLANARYRQHKGGASYFQIVGWHPGKNAETGDRDARVGEPLGKGLTGARKQPGEAEGKIYVKITI
jgi:hypothetical protein